MDFNVESLPYLFHIEFTDSWTHKSKGVFVDPNGTEYRYKDTGGWKPFYEVNETILNDTIDIDAETYFANIKIVIKPESLFHNLSLCRTKKPFTSWFSKNKVVVSDEIIKDLMTSEVVRTSDFIIHDAPTTTYSLLVYDGVSGSYKEIHLCSTDYRGTKNSSVYTDSLVAKFPRL